MPVLRALGALAVLVGVVVGVPWLLLTTTAPSKLLGLSWPTALLQPDDGTALLGLLGVVGWLAWLVLVVSVVAECAARLSRGRWDVRIPGTGWARSLAAPLVAAVLLLPGVAAHAIPVEQAEGRAPVTQSHDVTPPPSSSTDEDAQGSSSVESSARIHVCTPGEELWTVAEEQLGNGARWRDLLALNPGLSAASRLEPGQELLLPPDVEVRAGDSLWTLADRHLGDGRRWGELHARNQPLITDPDVIEVGWRLVLPGRQASDDEGSVAGGAPAPGPSSEADAGYTPVPDHGPASTPVTGHPTSRPSAAPAPPSAHATGATATTVSQADGADGGTWSSAPVRDVLGPLGGMLASALVVGVAARRRLQLVGRAVGQRLVPLSPEAGRFWTALARGADDEAGPGIPSPTTVVLGWRDDGTDVVHHLEEAMVTELRGGDVQGIIGALVTSLLCAPWSTETEVILVGADQPWATAIDDPRLTQFVDADEAIDHLTTLWARRRSALGGRSIAELRTDPDQAPQWAPVVALFASPLEPGAARKLSDASGFGPAGISVVAEGLRGRAVVVGEGPVARLGDTPFHPQLLTRPARRAVVELFASTGSIFTEGASWWHPGKPRRALGHEPPSMSTNLHWAPEAPHLVLLGEPTLRGARGTPPSRAKQQCVEYAAWLLHHGRSTPTAMLRSLCVAEGTRRSNLSRLRRWLGHDDDGERYLPEGYDGRVGLSRSITSDWHRVQALVDGAVNDASTDALRAAMALVEGPPLGSAVDRWGWARTWHDDMVAYLVDVACELADRCLAASECAEALSVLEHMELAAPGHDEIRIRVVRARRLLGDGEATEAAVEQFLAAAREDNREIDTAHSRELALARRRA